MNQPIPSNQSSFDLVEMVKSIFDFSFSTFLTTRLVRIAYIGQLCLIGLLLIVSFFSSLWMMFKGQFFAGFAAFVVSVVFSVLSVIMARLSMELIIVLFRIAEALIEQNASSKAQGQQVPGQFPPMH